MRIDVYASDVPIPQKSHTVKISKRSNEVFDLVTFTVQHPYITTELAVGVRQAADAKNFGFI